MCKNIGEMVWHEDARRSRVYRYCAERNSHINWQITHNVWQIPSPSKSDIINIINLPRSRGRSAGPVWLLGRELCQYEHNVSSTYASRSQTLAMTFARSSSSVLQRVHHSCKTARKLKNGWVVEWEWIFQRKSNVLVQKQKCGISNDVFSCRSGTAELQITVCCAKLRNFKSQIVLCAKTEPLNFERKYIPCAEAKLRNFKSQNILCVEAELRDLKSKLLYGSGTTKLQVVPNLLYGSGTAWLPSHSIFLVRKRNCAISELQVTHYSVCGSWTAEL